MPREQEGQKPSWSVANESAFEVEEGSGGAASITGGAMSGASPARVDSVGSGGSVDGVDGPGEGPGSSPEQQQREQQRERQREQQREQQAREAEAKAERAEQREAKAKVEREQRAAKAKAEREKRAAKVRAQSEKRRGGSVDGVDRLGDEPGSSSGDET